MKNVSRSLELSLKIFNLLAFLGGVLILISLSYDIVYLKEQHLGRGFLEMQFVICMVFLIDFFLRFYAASHPGKYLLRNFLFLLVSIPWVNIIHWMNIDISQSMYIIIKSAPLLRGFYGMIIVIRGITRSGIGDLMLSYTFTVIGFTYFAALIFYFFEQERNPNVLSFGDCLWWAWMNVTTVGANIFAVTAIGKILSVLLPSLGMMMFPIFTVYVIDHFKRLHATKSNEKEKVKNTTSRRRKRQGTQRNTLNSGASDKSRDR